MYQEAQRALISDAMGDYGQCKNCSNPMEALMLVFQSNEPLPDLIIMPYREICGMGGLVALRRLRQRGCNIPVILIVDERERSECQETIKGIRLCCCSQWDKLSGEQILLAFEQKPNVNQFRLSNKNSL